MKTGSSISRLAALGAILVCCLTGAAISQQQQPPGGASAAASRGLMQNRSSSSPEEALYVEKCSMCHREMGMGTVLLQRRDGNMSPVLEKRGLAASYITMVARRGLGNMPAIPRGEVSDDQLSRIAAYLAKGGGK